MGLFSTIAGGVANGLTGGALGIKQAIQGKDPTKLVATDYNSFNDILDPTGAITNDAEKNAAYNNAVKTISDIIAQNNGTQGEIRKNIADNTSAITRMLGGEGKVGEYTDAISTLAGSDYSTDTSALKNYNSSLKDYSFGKSVDDFLDPAAEYQINKSVTAAQNAMAGQGGLSGGAAAAQLQAVASEKSSELYDKAYDRFLKAEETDYNRKKDIEDTEYQQLKDILDAEQNNSNMRFQQDSANVSNLGNLSGQIVGNMQNGFDQYNQSLMSQMESNSNLMQTLAQMGLDKANSSNGWASDILSGLLG